MSSTRTIAPISKISDEPGSCWENSSHSLSVLLRPILVTANAEDGDRPPRPELSTNRGQSLVNPRSPVDNSTVVAGQGLR